MENGHQWWWYSLDLDCCLYSVLHALVRYCPHNRVVNDGDSLAEYVHCLDCGLEI